MNNIRNEILTVTVYYSHIYEHYCNFFVIGKGVVMVLGWIFILKAFKRQILMEVLRKELYCKAIKYQSIEKGIKLKNFLQMSFSPSFPKPSRTPAPFLRMISFNLIFIHIYLYLIVFIPRTFLTYKKTYIYITNFFHFIIYVNIYIKSYKTYSK